MCDSSRADVYVLFPERPFSPPLGDWSPIKLSRAFIMGPNTCTRYYIAVAPILFFPCGLLSCFLSSFLSIRLSLSDCFCLQLSCAISFCFTLSCQAHNFIFVFVCRVGVGEGGIPTVMTLEWPMKQVTKRQGDFGCSCLRLGSGSCGKAPMYQWAYQTAPFDKTMFSISPRSLWFIWNWVWYRNGCLWCSGRCHAVYISSYVCAC